MKKTILLLSILLVTGCKKNTESVIIIGGILPLTGAGAEAGTSAKNATVFCIDNWNKKGGICGIPIRSKFLDSQADPKLGHSLAHQLVSYNNPNIVVEGISGVALNTQPILEKNKVIQLAIVATDNILINAPKYTIRNYTIPSEICRQFLFALQNKFQQKDFVLFYADTEYALTFKTEFEKQTQKGNVHLKGAYPYLEKDMSFKNTILKSKIQKNDVIYISGQYQALGRMIKQLRELGYNGPIVSDSHLNSYSVLNTIGKYLNNLYYINIKKTAEAEELMSLFEAKFGKPMDDFALLTYNGLNIILSYMSENHLLTNDEIMQGINGYEYRGPIGSSKIVNNDVIIEFELRRL